MDTAFGDACIYNAVCLCVNCLSTSSQPFLRLAALWVRALWAPQHDLSRRRTDLAALVILQMIGYKVGDRSNEDWIIVHAFRSRQVHTELHYQISIDIVSHLCASRHERTLSASSFTSISSSNSVSM